MHSKFLYNLRTLFDGVKNLSDFYNFYQAHFCRLLQSNYDVKEVDVSSDINEPIFIYNAKPKDVIVPHRAIVFIFKFTAGSLPNMQWHQLSNNINNAAEIQQMKSYLIRRCLSLVQVPYIRKRKVGDLIIMHLENMSYTYQSNNMLKLYFPHILVAKMTLPSTWDQKEKLSLAVNFIRGKEFKYDQLCDRIVDQILTNIEVFVQSFKNASLTYQQLWQVFESFYDINNRYHLFKLKSDSENSPDDDFIQFAKRSGYFSTRLEEFDEVDSNVSWDDGADYDGYSSGD